METIPYILAIFEKNKATGLTILKKAKEKNGSPTRAFGDDTLKKLKPTKKIFNEKIFNEKNFWGHSLDNFYMLVKILFKA